MFEDPQKWYSVKIKEELSPNVLKILRKNWNTIFMIRIHFWTFLRVFSIFWPQTVKGAKQTPPNTLSALKDLNTKKNQLFHCGSLKNANLVNVSKHQKVQSCFSFFALKKSFWRIIAFQKSFCQKWLSRKKVRLQQWKKVSVAFCKKGWIWDNNNLCVAKRLQEQKRPQKARSV